MNFSPYGRHKRRVRNAKRKLRAKRSKHQVVAKTGVRPLSMYSNLHPARRYGWDDKRTLFRDRSMFV